MSTAFRALLQGLWDVARAPGVLALVCLIATASAVPFAIVLGNRLQEALANQPPIDLDAEEIDADWWLEFRKQARGLDATFTPAIIGFAAPLDNLSALADGTSRPWALVGPALMAALVWAFLWGVLIDRFQAPGSLGRAIRAGVRHFPKMAVVSLTAGAVVIVLYATVHRVLFDWVFPAITASMADEGDAFAVRVGLYLLFGALLAAVALTADYTRIALVGRRIQPLGRATSEAVRFMRTHSPSVVTLYLTTGALLVGLFVVYAVVDRRAGGWRGVVVGQAYILARLAIRLVAVASQVALVNIHTKDTTHTAGAMGTKDTIETKTNV